MNKIITATLLAFLLGVSCSQKANTEQEAQAQNKEETPVEKIDTKNKSNFEIRKALEGQFTRKQHGDIIQILPNFVGEEGDGTYCYFLSKGNRIISLSLHIQYSEFNANFYELELNGESMTYEANKDYTTQNNHVIAEGSTFKWFDRMINKEDEAFLRKIGEAGKATLKLKKEADGEVIQTINLSRRECQALINTIEYYLASNGAKIPKKGMVNIRSF